MQIHPRQKIDNEDSKNGYTIKEIYKQKKLSVEETIERTKDKNTAKLKE